MGEMVFYHGTMGDGKSTLALQMNHNLSQIGRTGLLFTVGDRSGKAQITSRIGVSAAARRVKPERDLFATIRTHIERSKVTYVICDEVQFYAPKQIEQLSRAASLYAIDVYAFGLMTDFRSELFPGSARMVALADEVIRVQSQMPCWCGQSATHNARVKEGAMVTTGEQVVVGDLASGKAAAEQYEYVVLCRKHYHLRCPFR